MPTNSNRVDRALEHAAQQHRLCRRSNRRIDETFRRDQVTTILHRLRLPLPPVC